MRHVNAGLRKQNRMKAPSLGWQITTKKGLEQRVMVHSGVDMAGSNRFPFSALIGAKKMGMILHHVGTR